MMDFDQAFRGASSSIGVVTSIRVNTFAAPPSATIFVYNWDLSDADAASATKQFQNFVQTNIPAEFSGDIIFQKGSSRGRVNLGLTGGWYGPPDQLAKVIAPFLNALPPPGGQNISSGTYIESVEILGRLGRLNTTGIPDTRDTFYAKSIMTPEASPMTIKTLNALMSYLGDTGFTATDTVR